MNDIMKKLTNDFKSTNQSEIFKLLNTFTVYKWLQLTYFPAVLFAA